MEKMMLLIKKYRNEKNISLRELSRITGLTNGYLSKLECNKKNPTLTTIAAIGHALEICPIKLLGGCYGHICNIECSYYCENNFSRFPVEAQEEFTKFIKYMNSKYNTN